MRSTSILTNQQISDAYNEYSGALYRYILYKVNDADLAEDMLQDSFLKLLEHRGEVRIDTVKSLLFVTVRNIITDYVRRQVKYGEVLSEYYTGYDEASDSVESKVNADDIAGIEKKFLKVLPNQRRIIYMMSRFMDKSSDEIADNMNLSKRTVESHLFIGRKEIRNLLRKYI